MAAAAAAAASSAPVASTDSADEYIEAPEMHPDPVVQALLESARYADGADDLGRLQAILFFGGVDSTVPPISASRRRELLLGSDVAGGRNALQMAAANGHIETMLTILKLAGWRGEATPTASASTENAETRAMASPIDFLVNAVTHDGGTALHEAARNNQLEAVRVLLKAGFDPAARDSSGRTPLHIAEAEDFQQVAVVLLEADRTLDENKPGVMSFGTDEEAAAMSKLRVDPELEELERKQREQLQAAATTPKPAPAVKPTVQAPVDVDEVE